jgi:hypothetical protein
VVIEGGLATHCLPKGTEFWRRTATKGGWAVAFRGSRVYVTRGMVNENGNPGFTLCG